MTDSPSGVLTPKKIGFPKLKETGKKSFVVVVDVQYDFMRPSGALYVPDAEMTGKKINKFLSSLTAQDCAGVLFTFDTHYIDEYSESEEAKQFPPHCLASTPGWALDCDYQQIAMGIPLWMLYKNYFDMWREDNSVEKDIYSYPVPRHPPQQKQSHFFDALKDQVSNVIVIGVASDYCVRYAINGFIDRNFKVITDPNLCAHIERPIDQVCEELQKDLKSDASLEIWDLMPKNHVFQGNGWFRNSNASK